MITQKFTNGQSEIKIESAISMEDAKKNNFPEGNLSRIFIDDKPIQSQMEMINHIVKEVKITGKRFYPQSHEELRKIQNEVFTTHTNALKQNMLKLKAQYKSMEAPDYLIKQIDEMMTKIDVAGVRVLR
jgi:hypothetical protein